MTRANGNRRNGKRPAANGPRPRFDRSAAFAFYVGLGPTRTYASVASEFGVSDTTIRKHAHAEDWEAKAAAVDEATAKRAAARAERDLEEFRFQALLVGNRLLDDLAIEGRGQPKASDYQGIVKTLMLVYGEATDRAHITLDEHRVVEEGYHETILWLLDERQSGRTPSPEALLERLQRATVGALEQGNGAGA